MPQIAQLSLQIPHRTGPQSQHVTQVPNGFQFELSGVKMTITSTVTPERQMISLSIDLDSISRRK